MTRLAVIGAGVMGEALVSGLLRAGWSADAVVPDPTDIATAKTKAIKSAKIADQFLDS